MIGIGGSTYQKQFDGFSKFKLLRQAQEHMPVTVCVVSSIVYKSLKFEDPGRENYLSSNLSYTGQFLVARKFSEGFSLQLMPTVIHYNLVKGTNESNGIFAMGAGSRIKISKRVSINAEYYYQLPQFHFQETRTLLPSVLTWRQEAMYSN